MPPAARVGDLTSHGTPLGPGPGSPNVMIGGMPAWRATVDMHTCPVPGTPPHAGGMIIMGSMTVTINGFPAVRMGDVITEAGPPNSVIAGEFTVMIG